MQKWNKFQPSSEHQKIISHTMRTTKQTLHMPTTQTSGQRMHGTPAGKLTRLKYINTPNKYPPGHYICRHCWVRLNRLRTGHGRFWHAMQKTGLREDESCSGGELKQDILSTSAQTQSITVTFLPWTKQQQTGCANVSLIQTYRWYCRHQIA